MASKKILVVAAHPDDEVLGCGGTMARHIDEGDKVYVVFMSDGVASRNIYLDSSSELEDRKLSASKSCRILGVVLHKFLGFPDNQMDSIPLLIMVKELEHIIQKINPSVVYTHHAGDLNIDHQITHRVVMTACRPIPDFSVREIYSFEVLSSTEWASVSTSSLFAPNYFVDISKQFDRKILALEEYKNEMRDFPHSRSFKAVKALMILRGVCVGLQAAESFKIERFIKSC